MKNQPDETPPSLKASLGGKSGILLGILFSFFLLQILILI